MKKYICLLLSVFLFVGCAELKEIYKYSTMTDEERAEYQRQQEQAQRIDSIYQNACKLYEGNKNVNTQKTYSQFMNELAQKLNSEGIKVNGTITANMPFHDVAYMALDTQIKQLNTVLPYLGKFEQEECYRNLIQQVQIMQNVQNAVCRKAWTYEENEFKRQTGLKLPATRESIYVTNPQKGTLYVIKGRVLQNTKGGILISNDGKIRFLSTSYTYPDDEYISGFATYSGVFQYITTLGSSKTVLSFKQITNTKYDSLYKNLLFYPTSTEKSCSPRRQPTFAELNHAFKSPSQTFLEKWGTQEADYKDDSEYSYSWVDVALAKRNFDEQINKLIIEIKRNEGILSTINTLFLE